SAELLGARGAGGLRVEQPATSAREPRRRVRRIDASMLPANAAACSDLTADSERVAGLGEEPRLQTRRGEHARSGREVAEVLAHAEVLDAQTCAERQVVPEDLLDADVGCDADVRERRVPLHQVRVVDAADER